MPDISVPALSLVVLVGVSGSGKSTFAAHHFAPTQVLSSDFCRGLVADDENDQSATRDAFDVLLYIAGTRLRRGLLTVVDATNVQRESRKALIDLASRTTSWSMRSWSTFPTRSRSSATRPGRTAVSVRM